MPGHAAYGNCQAAHRERPEGGDGAAGGGVAGPVSVSVVLPVRNRAHLIGPCLQAVIQAAGRLAQTGTPVEVVAVDDASEDGTRAILDRMAATSPVPVRPLALPHRHGPARARNTAVEAARGELIVFVDSDEVVVEEFLEAHVEVHRRLGPGIFGVGTIISVPSAEAALERPPATIWDFATTSLNTGNSSVRKEDFDRAGRFDDRFEGMGWEDIDLGRRLRKLGFRRVPVPKAVAYHVQPPLQTRAALELQLAKERERGRSAVYFLAKHREFSARLTTQATRFHAFLNWLFRMGGLVREENVLAWVRWARERRLVALEKMWLAGVINDTYLRSLRAAAQSGQGQE